MHKPPSQVELLQGTLGGVSAGRLTDALSPVRRFGKRGLSDGTKIAGMVRLALLTLMMAGGLMAASDFDQIQAARFAKMALDCVHKEYPNKIAHSLSSDADVKPPRELTPAFFGCYDWHSSVHGHWLLVRLARLFPTAPFAVDARHIVGQSITSANIAQEVKYLNAEGRNTFERPYGLAWLLQLAAELKEWNDPEAREWFATLRPLEQAVTAGITSWLPRLDHPIRTGEHNNTAFGMGLMLDYARITGNADFARLVESRARDYYLKDRNCPLSYEPSGEDFLSPCLAEADLMRRVLGQEDFARWLGTFLPQIPRTRGTASAAWLTPGVVTDRADPKLAHIDGLNLSRAWMLAGIAHGLPPHDPRIAALLATAAEH